MRSYFSGAPKSRLRAKRCKVVRYVDSFIGVDSIAIEIEEMRRWMAQLKEKNATTTAATAARALKWKDSFKTVSTCYAHNLNIHSIKS